MIKRFFGHKAHINEDETHDNENIAKR